MIYLASPYSHPDSSVRESRFHDICCVAGKMLQRGDVVHSPIAHTHPIAVICELPTGWDFWRRLDHEYIRRCDAVYVVMMDGWRESKGVAAEVEIANELGKPVVFIDEQLNVYPNPDTYKHGQHAQRP